MTFIKKLTFIFNFVVVISLFMPMITANATGSLKLVNENQWSNGGVISFYSNESTPEGYPKLLDKICINGVFVNLNVYQYTKSSRLPQIENIYSGAIMNPQKGVYKFKYPDNQNCNAILNKELTLNVKPFHQYEINIVKNNSNGFDLNLKQDKYDGDVQMTTTDNNIQYDGNTRGEVGNCLDNVLVSNLSQSSKMAFLTTSDDEPQFPKVTVGEHIVSSYDGTKCLDNGINVNIKPNTWYIFEVPLNSSAPSVVQSISNTKPENISSSIDNGRGASTIRTGGYSWYNYSFLVVVMISLIQIFIPNQSK